MFRNLSHKSKLYIILSGLILTLIICYNVAFKSTFLTMANYRQLKTREKEAKDVPAQTAVLQKELTDLNAKYFNDSGGPDNNHEVILEKLSRLTTKYSASITEYPELHVYRSSKVLVETHEVVLKGSFLNLLHVLYELEVNERIGRIVSMDYFIETNRKTKLKSLYLRIFIQNYRNLNSHEEN